MLGVVVCEEGAHCCCKGVPGEDAHAEAFVGTTLAEEASGERSWVR